MNRPSTPTSLLTHRTRSPSVLLKWLRNSIFSHSQSAPPRWSREVVVCGRLVIPLVRVLVTSGLALM